MLEIIDDRLTIGEDVYCYKNATEDAARNIYLIFQFAQQFGLAFRCQLLDFILLTKFKKKTLKKKKRSMKIYTDVKMFCFLSIFVFMYVYF